MIIMFVINVLYNLNIAVMYEYGPISVLYQSFSLYCNVQSIFSTQWHQQNVTQSDRPNFPIARMTFCHAGQGCTVVLPGQKCASR